MKFRPGVCKSQAQFWANAPPALEVLKRRYKFFDHEKRINASRFLTGRLTVSSSSLFRQALIEPSASFCVDVQVEKAALLQAAIITSSVGSLTVMA